MKCQGMAWISSVLHSFVILIIDHVIDHPPFISFKRPVPSLGYGARGVAIFPSKSFNQLMENTTMKIKRFKCKDANPPKKNVSAHLIYQKTMRNQFKADHPGMSFGQLSSYTSYVSSVFHFFVPLFDLVC